MAPRATQAASPGPVAYIAIAVGVAALVLAGYSLVATRAQADSASATRAVLALAQSDQGGVVYPQELDGTQRVHIDATADGFSPSRVVARAGEPLVVIFSRGSGITDSVAFPTLGVRRDLSRRGTTVYLDSPRVGVYRFTAGTSQASGTIIVE